jgi:cyclic beta-1,2-glucan synthetase
MLSKAKVHVSCSYDATNEAILAVNRWNHVFSPSVAFLTSSLPPHSVSGDRADFLGDDASATIPEGMTRSDLGGRFTPGADSCAAYQVHLDIPPLTTSEFFFVLGEGADRTETESLLHRWRSGVDIDTALSAVSDFWNRLFNAVQVHSPDPGFDLLVNRWLPYQSVSSRLHARAGFYQAGGAFGFRDQLQDVLACLASDPQRVRRQLLLAAAHQFEEGDVLHWWHPPEDRGVRTRISDDYLWLAYVTARYIDATGDRDVLDVGIPYLSAPLLGEEEVDRYAAYEQGSQGTLFEHCCRAIAHGLGTGAHGLPLIGSGDWNDGMDRVGDKGRGESVWLAWFQIATLRLFIPLAAERGEHDLTARWQQHIDSLKLAVDGYAWDGRWYLRAFDDEGEPWGSLANDECQIDVIAQAWGALAGYAEEARVIDALQAAYERLVDHEHRIVRLLTPPFHDTPRNPGYIKAYPPGIRENGGQYTHAAAWLGLGFAAIGDADKAYEVFSMINPTDHSTDRQAVERYAREPYVLSADIGGAGMHEGRGGWSWYTGAAGWTWQLAVHGILGIHLQPGAVRLQPLLPGHWNKVDIQLRSGQSSISLTLERSDSLLADESRMTVDGQLVQSTVVDFPAPSTVRTVLIQLPLRSAHGHRQSTG